MNRCATLVIAVVSLVLVLSIATATQDRFPNAPGRAELLKRCQGCHEPDIVLSQAQTVGEWADTLASMVQLGAEGTDEEWRLIERYLDSQLAMIPINKAAAAEIQLTFDVSEALAQAIVDYRRERGNFKSIDELKKVPGLEAGKVDARKDRLIF